MEVVKIGESSECGPGLDQLHTGMPTLHIHCIRHVSTLHRWKDQEGGRVGGNGGRGGGIEGGREGGREERWPHHKMVQ